MIKREVREDGKSWRAVFHEGISRIENIRGHPHVGNVHTTDWGVRTSDIMKNNVLNWAIKRVLKIRQH